VSGDNTKTLCYTFNILNADGTIQKSNIRRSIPLTQESVLNSILNTNNIIEISEAIRAYLAENTVI
jgi:hypothetical protein